MRPPRLAPPRLSLPGSVAKVRRPRAPPAVTAEERHQRPPPARAVRCHRRGASPKSAARARRLTSPPGSVAKRPSQRLRTTREDLAATRQTSALGECGLRRMHERVNERTPAGSRGHHVVASAPPGAPR
uniref:uncharacterized protein LOC128928309 isoform X2 n=1 Tax=Callithrix jacchus TaxID=9483 RepID=UPI0023DD57FA|nr:uncharacterized protein LOC128928309 isoform X2 [Callithrix jacchus]